MILFNKKEKPVEKQPLIKENDVSDPVLDLDGDSPGKSKRKKKKKD